MQINIVKLLGVRNVSVINSVSRRE